MGPQSHGSPNFGNFKTPTWESWDKMAFGARIPIAWAPATLGAHNFTCKTLIVMRSKALVKSFLMVCRMLPAHEKIELISNF
jgi:hypothetical protein